MRQLDSVVRLQNLLRHASMVFIVGVRIIEGLQVLSELVPDVLLCSKKENFRIYLAYLAKNIPYDVGCLCRAPMIDFQTTSH